MTQLPVRLPHGCAVWPLTPPGGCFGRGWEAVGEAVLTGGSGRGRGRLGGGSSGEGCALPGVRALDVYGCHSLSRGAQRAEDASAHRKQSVRYLTTE